MSMYSCTECTNVLFDVTEDPCVSCGIDKGEFFKKPTITSVEDWVATPSKQDLLRATKQNKVNAKPDTKHELQKTFDACILQVTKGKGVRHGGGETSFFLQPWHTIAQQTGPGGLVFQGMKKAGEACSKPDKDTFERELLGAIVYLAMAYLFVQEHGFTGVVK